MKYDGSYGGILVVAAFLTFLIGAIVTGDRDGVSFHNSLLVLQSGLAIYMLALLVGYWKPAP